MGNKRVLLICSQHLLGESMEQILRGAEDMELIGPWEALQDTCERIPEAHPDVVVIVEDEAYQEPLTPLTGALIEAYTDLPIIRARLSENTIRIFSTHLLPASGIDLVETIRRLPSWELVPAEIQPTQGEASDANTTDSLVHAAHPDGDAGLSHDPDGAGSAAGAGPGEW